VGVRAAQNLPVQQPGKLDIAAVLSAAGDLVHTVGTGEALSNDPVLNLG
jgi:hypothetical protein